MIESELVQFKLMLPADLKDRVAERAQNNRRSLSQEIVAALLEKFPPPPPLEDMYVSELVAWSDRLEAARNTQDADKLLLEANDWLKKHGMHDTVFVWVHPFDDVGERLPATMRQVKKRTNSLDFKLNDEL